MIARQIYRTPPAITYDVVGGFTHQIQKNDEGEMYRGPEWFTKGMNSIQNFGAIRKN